jgi:eukaryotic-like serine/threonine-protein kinase
VAAALEVPRVLPPAPPPRPVEEQTTIPSVPQPARAGGTRAMDRAEIGVGEPPPHLQARRRSRRLFAAWIAVVLVLALGIGATAWWLGTGRWTAMPSIVGLQQTAAERLLADADLVPTATTGFDDSVAAGLVTKADPGPDARLLRGSAVTIVVSRGRPAVPAIAAGTSVSDAERAVRAATLNPVQSSSADEYSESVPEGAVIRTDPPAGTLLASGGTVTLVVSSGATPPEPEQVRVPLVIGQSFDEAESNLEEVGLKAEEVQGFPFGRRNGRVVDQSNGAGSMVAPGTTIQLTTF